VWAQHQCPALIHRYARVTDAGLEHLKGLTSLQRLWLGEIQVTGAGPEHLKGLTSLKSLGLNGTQLARA
jgi:hypothetical protein